MQKFKKVCDNLKNDDKRQTSVRRENVKYIKEKYLPSEFYSIKSQIKPRNHIRWIISSGLETADPGYGKKSSINDVTPWKGQGVCDNRK